MCKWSVGTLLSDDSILPQEEVAQPLTLMIFDATLAGQIDFSVGTGDTVLMGTGTIDIASFAGRSIHNQAGSGATINLEGARCFCNR